MKIKTLISQLSIKPSIQYKMIGSMLAVLIIYGILVVTYSNQVISIIQHNNSEIKVINQKKDSVLSVKDNILSQINSTLLYMYTGDESNLDRLESYINQLNQTQKYISSTFSRDERNELNSFIQKNDDLSFTLHDEVIPVYQYGHKKEAFEVLNKKVRPGYLHVLQASDKYTKLLSVKIDEDIQNIMLLRHEEMRYLFFMLIGGVVSIIGISFYLWRRITKPIASLLEAVRKMASGDLKSKVKLKNSDDDFTELGAAFNQMTSNIELLINKQEQMNQQLQIETQKAKEGHRLQSQFLANMSHELRTPLTVILGFCELLLETAENEYKTGLLQRIYNSSEHLLTLINDLLDLAKIEAGKMDIHKRPFILNDVIKESIDTLETTARNKHILMELDIKEDTIEAFGDRTKIKQVLLNLLSNAVKFSMDNTKIIIKAEQTERNIILSVKDEGIGIPEHMEEKIFNRFYQVDGTLERKYGGTGLGLPLTKELVHLHGGTITVNSKLREGSEFIVSLPNDRSNRTTIGLNDLFPVNAPMESLVF